MIVALKSTLFVLLTALFVNQSAQASLLLEPYLGYVTGKRDMSTSNNFTGTEYGARVGYSMLGFAIGADYQAVSVTDDGSPKTDLTSGDLGLFVAYKFPVLVHAYASYFPSPEAKFSNSGASGTYKSGNVMKLGVGFTGFPIVNVNLEYISGTYGKASAGGFEADINPKMTTSAYAISISAPFNFL